MEYIRCLYCDDVPSRIPIGQCQWIFSFANFQVILSLFRCNQFTEERNLRKFDPPKIWIHIIFQVDACPEAGKIVANPEHVDENYYQCYGCARKSDFGFDHYPVHFCCGWNAALS